MATDKKHIAVYLDPAVEQALIAFCEKKGLISKKGFMYSAGVNAALAEFFNIVDIETGNIPPNAGNIPGSFASNIPAEGNLPFKDNIPLDMGNILPRRDNIPGSSASNIPLESSNIPLKSLVMEVLPGKQKA
jgi:hypothetical protein